MNFTKLGIVALSASAIFMATSCNNKGLSYKGTIEWLEKHYTKPSSEKVILKSGEHVLDFSATKGEQARAFVKTMFESTYPLDDNLKYNHSYTEEELEEPQSGIDYFLTYRYYLNKESFMATFPTEEAFKQTGAVITVSNNKLTTKLTVDAKEMLGDDYKGKMTTTVKYDADGAAVENIQKMSGLNVKGVSGTANGYEKVTIAH